MQDAGVDVLRLEVDWGKVQRSRGAALDWRRIDGVIRGASKRGIEVIPQIYGMPGRLAREKGALSGLPTSGGDLRAWRQFVRAAIERYGARGSIWRDAAADATPPITVGTWQVSLRPGAGATTSAQRNALVRAYTGLLASARRVAEDSEPGVGIAADVELARPPGNARKRGLTGKLIRKLANASAAPDSIATVTLRPRGRPGAGLGKDIAQLRDVLSRVGLDDTRLIVAPIGWASDKRLSKRMSVGRRKQATFLRESFKLIDENMTRWGVESVIWSAWRDGARSRDCDWCRKSGLLSRGGRPKPSFRAFKALAADREAQRVDQAPGSELGPYTNEFFGVQPAVAVTDSDARAMATAGVGTVRLVIYWPAVQPGGAGPFQWGDVDRVFEQLAENGIRPLPVLLGNRNEADELASSGLPRWRAFVATTVDRYGPGGGFWTSFSAEHPGTNPLYPANWQIWNEQNSRGFWRPEPSVEGYARLLHASAEAVRGEDPNAEIVLGGMYGYSNMNADDYLRTLYSIPGAASDFDIVAAHPYGRGNPEIARQIDALRQEMDSHGDGLTDMWITETGWSSVPIDDPNYSHLTRDEPGQAAALDAAFRMYLDRRQEWRLRGVSWYSWRDSQEEACIFCQFTGLVRNDGSGKPALLSFAAFAKGVGP